MMKKVKNDLIVIIAIVGMVLIGIIYVSHSARNVVFMDFWRVINHYIPIVMQGECSLGDFWISVGGQRNVFQNFMIVFNIKYTGLNCIWESYAGILIIGISAYILYRNWRNNLQTELNCNNVVSQVIFLPVILFLFNLNQWEILSTQFSFAFMLRVFSYISGMILLDKILQDENCNLVRFVINGIYWGVIIDFMSQLYWISLVITLFVTWGVHFVRKRDVRNYFWKFTAFWIPIVLSILIYFWNIESSGIKAGSELLEIICSGDLFMAVFYMLASSVLPQTTITMMKSPWIIAIGILLLLIVVLAVLLYLKNGLDKKTYVPMMLCAYGLLSIPIITYGRISRFDLGGLTASRYTCETTLIWCGCILAFSYLFFYMRRKWLILPICILVIFVGRSDYTEMQLAPYRGEYREHLIQMLEDIDEYEDDELSVFQANSVEYVRQGTKLMEEYSLNIFKNN